MIGRRSQKLVFVKDIHFFLSTLRRKEKFSSALLQHIFFNRKCLFLSPSGWLTKLVQSASFLSPQSCHQSVRWQNSLHFPSPSLPCRMSPALSPPRARARVSLAAANVANFFSFSVFLFFLSFPKNVQRMETIMSTAPVMLQAVTAFVCTYTRDITASNV